MLNSVFVHNGEEFDVLAYSGYNVEKVAEEYPIQDWFDAEDVSGKAGFCIIECEYYCRFVDSAYAREVDCEFIVENVRRLHDWEWDDIVTFGLPLFPAYITVETENVVVCPVCSEHVPESAMTEFDNEIMCDECAIFRREDLEWMDMAAAEMARYMDEEDADYEE